MRPCVIDTGIVGVTLKGEGLTRSRQRCAAPCRTVPLDKMETSGLTCGVQIPGKWVSVMSESMRISGTAPIPSEEATNHLLCVDCRLPKPHDKGVLQQS
jgi:hypothetical protein